MRTMAALLAAFVLFGCSTTEPLIVTGEWQTYGEVQEYVLSLNKEVDRQFRREFFPPL